MKRRQSFTSNCNSSINSQLNQLHRPRKTNINRIQVLVTLLFAFFLLINHQGVGAPSNLASAVSTLSTVQATNIISNTPVTSTIVGPTTTVFPNTDLNDISNPEEWKKPLPYEIMPVKTIIECPGSEEKIELERFEDNFTNNLRIHEPGNKTMELVFELSIPQPQFETVETPEGSFERFCPGYLERRYLRQGDEFFSQPELPLYSFMAALPIGSKIKNLKVTKSIANGIEAPGTTHNVRLYPVQPKQFSKLSFLSQLKGNIRSQALLPILNSQIPVLNPMYFRIKRPFVFDKEEYERQSYSLEDRFPDVVVQRFRNNIQKVSFNIFEYDPVNELLTSWNELNITITVELDTNKEFAYRGFKNESLSPVEWQISKSLPAVNFANYRDPVFTIPMDLKLASSLVLPVPPLNPDEGSDPKIKMDLQSLASLWAGLRVYNEDDNILDGAEQIVDFFNLKKYSDDTGSQGIELNLNKDFGIRALKNSFLFDKPVFKNFKEGTEQGKGLTLIEALNTKFDLSDITINGFDNPIVFNVAVDSGGDGEFSLQPFGLELDHQLLTNIDPESNLGDGIVVKNSTKRSVAIEQFPSSIVSKNAISKNVISGEGASTSELPINLGPAELLVIYDSTLIAEAQKLQEHKNTNNLVTEIVNTGQILEACNSCLQVGEPPCELTDVLVKQYIKAYVAKYNSLLYILLLGDTTLIPSHTDINTPDATDIYYGQFDSGDPTSPEMLEMIPQLPAILVGRLPAQTPEEANGVVTKLINYETTHSDLAQADNQGLINFRNTFTFATGLSTPMLDHEQLGLGSIGILCVDLVDITPANIYQGTMLCHRGNAGKDGWDAPTQFPNSHFPDLPQPVGDEQNAANLSTDPVESPLVGNYPFVLSLSPESVWLPDENCADPIACLNSWSVSFVKGENSGAIGVLGPSTPLSEPDNDHFMCGVFDNLINGNSYTEQGILYFNGLDNLVFQQQLTSPEQILPLISAFNLLGDPTLKIRIK